MDTPLITAPLPVGAAVAVATVVDSTNTSAAPPTGTPDPAAAWRGPAPLVVLGPAAAGRCRRRVHLDADPTADRSARTPMDDGGRHRLADMAAHRQQVLETVLRLHPDGVAGWTPDRPDRPRLLLAPQLRSATRVGSPDLLLWVDDGYVPVIVRGHRTTDPGAGAPVATLADPLARAADPTRKTRSHAEDVLVLAHHHRLLGDLGLASSSLFGGVIGRGEHAADDPREPAGAAGPGDAELIVWHDLAVGEVLTDYDARFADRLAVAAAAAAGGPALAAPSRIGECRRCAWWPRCFAELTAAHDISLIAAGGDVEVLQLAGIRTVDQLAALPAAEVDALPLTGIPATTARVRARAWQGGIPLVRRHERVRVPRADLELDVDMECYLDEGAYLWGTFLTGPAVQSLGLTAGYRPFVSWQPLPDRDEGRAFAEFWAYLDQLRGLAAERGLTFAAYCYSRTAEERWLRSTPRRYPEVPGMPSPAAVTDFCAGPQWVDIYQQIKDQFVVPGSMKLKVLAPLTGFGWRDADPGGENSMAWYRAAVGRATGVPDPVMMRRVLDYNEDDVRATLALRTWITESSGSMPTMAELDQD